MPVDYYRHQPTQGEEKAKWKKKKKKQELFSNFFFFMVQNLYKNHWYVTTSFKNPSQFHRGDGGLYMNSCGVPLFISKLWSCSISWERLSLKKSRRVVNSTRVDEARERFLPFSISWKKKCIYIFNHHHKIINFMVNTCFSGIPSVF